MVGATVKGSLFCLAEGQSMAAEGPRQGFGRSR